MHNIDKNKTYDMHSPAKESLENILKYQEWNRNKHIETSSPLLKCMENTIKLLILN